MDRVHLFLLLSFPPFIAIIDVQRTQIIHTNNTLVNILYQHDLVSIKMTQHVILI